MKINQSTELKIDLKTILGIIIVMLLMTVYFKLSFINELILKISKD